jgi:hypothetical protein
MSDQPDPAEAIAPEDIEEPQEPVALPKEEKTVDDEDEVMPDALDFCELCGSTEDDSDEEELLRCEECGRLHCSQCREHDDEGTPFCADCFDDISEE